MKDLPVIFSCGIIFFPPASVGHGPASPPALIVKHKRFPIFIDGRVQKIYERFQEGQVEPLMKGPETVIFDTHGVMHIMNEEGFLVQLSNLVRDHEDPTKLWATSHVVADLGMGRPLGGCFTNDNTLYIADAHLGLTRLSLNSPSAKVELVASRVMDQGQWTRILYANDVVVGPQTGRVYFTDCKWDHWQGRR